MWEPCGKGVIRIRVPLPGSPLKYTNSYLIPGPRNLLIDTGFYRPECKAALLEALASCSVSLAETDVFITHHHSDHVGLAPDVAAEGGVIYIGRTELEWLKKYQVDGWERFDARFAAEGFPAEALKQLQAVNPARRYAPPVGGHYRPVSDGQTLSYGGHTLICRSMPGHTPGHMCLHLPKQKLMFLGDHVLFDITPNIIAWPGVDNALADYLTSLRALQEYDIAIPLPGHREPGDLPTRIRALLRHHAARMQEAREVLTRKPGLTVYQLAGYMTWNIQSRSWNTFPLAQKWFAVGEAMAHVDALVAEGTVRVCADDAGVRHYAAT